MGDMIEKLSDRNVLASVVDSYENMKYSSYEVASIAYPMFQPGKNHPANTCRSIIYIMFKQRIYGSQKVKDALV